MYITLYNFTADYYFPIPLGLVALALLLIFVFIICLLVCCCVACVIFFHLSKSRNSARSVQGRRIRRHRIHPNNMTMIFTQRTNTDPQVHTIASGDPLPKLSYLENQDTQLRDPHYKTSHCVTPSYRKLHLHHMILLCNIQLHKISYIATNFPSLYLAPV